MNYKNEEKKKKSLVEKILLIGLILLGLFILTGSLVARNIPPEKTAEVVVTQ